MFDEAFHIVKAFIEMGTQNTIESLQAFTNTHIPAPYWVAVAPVLIPLQTCNRAADVLIDWFGADDLAKIVGGERWWQVRGLDGVEGEWVTEKAFLSETSSNQRKMQDADTLIEQMDHLEPVMFYVHGGGYFFGSINTHRYQIIRFAKKLKGRAFTVNYRKAPQYPWPCPLHDVIAAYLYLIDPPPDTPHRPVSPSKIVFAGDSAGGSLALTSLTVLRDMGIPLPAGAVLISPWVDLTHSFSSVMTNMKTDIIPPHGFVHKPSTLWPVVPVADADHPRIRQAQTNPPPEPGHADTLDPSPKRLKEQRGLRAEANEQQISMSEAQARRSSDGEVHLQRDMLGGAPENGAADGHEVESGGASQRRALESGGAEADADDLEKWEPMAPKVLMKDSDEVPLEVLSQIQQYATNEQLTHPLVSPILQGSLCNLPPLYIIAGDGEVLRDEIIHIAHRAAHPTDYPVRKGVLKGGRRQRENIEKFTTPTKVHLQVFDDMPHVLTVFTFIEAATYAYRSIAQFARHVTAHSPEHIARNPFPEFHRPECRFHMDHKLLQDNEEGEHWGACCCGLFSRRKRRPVDEEENLEGIGRYVENERTAAWEVEQGATDAEPGRQREAMKAVQAKGGDPQAQTMDIPHILMIRERVDIHGRVRAMEPREEVPALNVRPNEVGIIKEAPVRRWCEGQMGMDKKFAKEAIRIVKRRRKIEERIETMLREAREQGLVLAHDRGQARQSEYSNSSQVKTEGSDAKFLQQDGTPSASPQDATAPGPSKPKRKPAVRVTSGGSSVSAHTVSNSVRIDEYRRYGPLDLEGERPPPTAIAGRRDTLEALALVKKHVYHTAPATHLTVPKMKVASSIRAAFDPWNKVSTKPNQSVSERQVRSNMNPMHGLSIWSSLVSYFMRKTSYKATDAFDNIATAVDGMADAIVNGNNAPSSK